MIFDWMKNSESVMESKRFTLTDQWDAKHLYQQEQCLVYLMQSKMTYKEAESEFEAILDKTDPNHRYLPSDAAKKDFRVLWETAPSLSTEFKLRRDDSIAITEGEMADINALTSPKWYRCFVLLILGYYKFHKHYFRSVYLSKETMAWAYYYSHLMAGCPADSNAMRSKFVWRENALCGKPLRVKPLSGKVGLMIDWAVLGKSDAPKLVFSDPKELIGHADAVLEWVAECPKCHRLMRMSRYLKSPYCVYCRNETKNAQAKKKRLRKHK